MTTEHKVAAGKAVTSKRGLLTDGADVSARDFNNGAADLDKLVEAGVVVAIEPTVKVPTVKTKINKGKGRK